MKTLEGTREDQDEEEDVARTSKCAFLLYGQRARTLVLLFKWLTLILLASVALTLGSVIPLGLVSPGATVVQGPSSQAAVVGPDGGVVASSNIGAAVDETSPGALGTEIPGGVMFLVGTLAGYESTWLSSGSTIGGTAASGTEVDATVDTGSEGLDDGILWIFDLNGISELDAELTGGNVEMYLILLESSLGENSSVVNWGSENSSVVNWGSKNSSVVNRSGNDSSMVDWASKNSSVVDWTSKNSSVMDWTS
nr:unnamed protein product [Callosobruchus chinensis]